ncbi:acyltransferase family protein [Actinoplanes friuliensis]|uniref:Putative acyltransferase n=1 Tax=Actinoplanes friuliensis DSM 7358 TaxID=1246995 RepID=U5W0W2_9ACTN|nr:acyltransferase family protein [Actinoplanes friuliensis]AGZ41585.1 putative acyltransferase [Actinoplanes friuliensis DSM 7358]
MSTSTMTYAAATALPPPMQAAPPEAPVFRRDVAGLRAVAVLLLVAGQAGTGLAGGGVGIDVFFVISGFLLTGGIVRELERTGRLSLRRFYARRMTRLLPASAVVVAGTLAACWHWMPAAVRPAISWDSAAALTSTMNVRLVLQDGGVADPAPLQHFWSLALAAQFSLVWPLLLVVVALSWARRGRPSRVSVAVVLVALTGASFGLCVWQAATGQLWAFYGLPARAWEFGLGALVALGAVRLARLGSRTAAVLTWLGLAVVGVAVATYDDAPVPGVYAALLAVAGSALLIGGGCARPALGARRLLRLRPVQELGRVSFAWYLWHWPVLVLAPYVLGHPLSVPERLALVAGALVPAAMSTAAVENRIRLNSVLRARPGSTLVLGGVLTAVTAGLAVVLAALPVPAPPAPKAAAFDPVRVLASGQVGLAQLQRIIRADSTRRTLPATLTPSLDEAVTSVPRDGGCLASLKEELVSPAIARGCEKLGVADGGKLVVLFGDSHAQQWFGALDVVARKHGWRLAVFTKTDCGPARGTVGGVNRVGPYTECDRWRERALARIRQLRPAMVVMSGRNREASPLDVKVTAGPDQDWAEAWASTVLRVRESGALPVVVQDTPVAHFDVPGCLATRRVAADCHLEVLKSLLLSRQRFVRALVQVHGAKVVDTAAWFCTPWICPSVIGGTVVYRDDNHLTSVYAKRLAGLLDEQLATEGKNVD